MNFYFKRKRNTGNIYNKKLNKIEDLANKFSCDDLKIFY